MPETKPKEPETKPKIIQETKPKEPEIMPETKPKEPETKPKTINPYEEFNKKYSKKEYKEDISSENYGREWLKLSIKE